MTITQTTPKVVEEVLTTKGFRSREVVERDNLEIEYFNNIEGSKKVKQLRNNCRIQSIRKSIILNYS